MMAWRVLRGGLLTTVQDLGRPGMRRYGIPRNGAADPLSLQLGNILVGNDPGQAALECTAYGPKLQALRSLLVAVTGGRCQLFLDGEPLAPTGSFFVARDQVLELGAMEQGFRCYLAVGGGLDVPPVLGSRSTHLGAGFGGCAGRQLKAGDELAAFPAEPRRPRTLPPPPRREEGVLRVIPGPQAQGLSPRGLACLLEQTFTVTPDSNRMGCRLKGDPIEHRDSADIVSDGVPEGSIQLPGDGQPIIMLSDGQVTGGYVKPAVIITADLPLAAQLSPGEQVRFSPLELPEAYAALREQSAYLEQCRQQPEQPGGFYAIRRGDRTWQVHVVEEEG